MENQALIKEVAESIGGFIEYWGFKSIHGRVWALIYLSEEPISTPHIVHCLDVSKGLVSIAINELLEYGLIEQAGKVEHGALVYKAKNDVASVVRNILRERELVHLFEAETKMTFLESLSKEELEKSNISIKKLSKLKDLTMFHRNILAVLVKRNYKSMEDWLGLLRKVSKVLKFHSK